MVLGLLNQLMTVGELWTAGASHAGDSFSLSLGRQGATGFLLLTTWDPVAGSGRAPIVGRPPGQRWILGRGLRVGGPGKPPFWRTLKEFCKGLPRLGDLQNKHSTSQSHTRAITESIVVMVNPGTSAQECKPQTAATRH